MQSKANAIGDHGTAEFTLSTSTMGTVDEIQRIVDGTEKSTKKATQSLSKIVSTIGTHTVLAKGYSNQALMGVSMFAIGIDAP